MIELLIIVDNIMETQYYNSAKWWNNLIIKPRGVVVRALSSQMRDAGFDSRTGVVTLGKILYTNCLC